MAREEFDSIVPDYDVYSAQYPGQRSDVAAQSGGKIKQAALEESGLRRERDALAGSTLQGGPLEGETNFISVKP
jgi:hypothetical protein